MKKFKEIVLFLLAIIIILLVVIWVKAEAQDFNHNLIWHGAGFATFSTLVFIPDKIMLDNYEMKPLHRILGLVTMGVVIELVDLKESGEFSWGDIDYDLGGIASGYLITKAIKKMPRHWQILAAFAAAGSLIFKYSE